MSRSCFRTTAAVFVVLLAASPQARAWNDKGHRTVALLAYRQLSDTARAKVDAILENHPSKGFLLSRMGEDKPDGVSASEYLFVQAATWPDKIRAGELRDEFNPGNKKDAWHFINKPFVPQGEEGNLNAQPQPPGDDVETILTTLRQSAKGLTAAEVEPGDRAQHLSWLLHLTGDIHQPLHCTVLFSGHFPGGNDDPEGDRGGNWFLIDVKPKKTHVTNLEKPAEPNLHSFWDDLLGKEEDYQSVVDAFNDLTQDDDLKKEKFAVDLGMNDFNDWAQRSFDLARKEVYPDVLPVGLSRIEAVGQVVTIPLFPDGYADSALALARQRVALAGFRLAQQLQSLFDPAQ